MIRAALTALALTLPAVAGAQGLCAGDLPAMDPCLAGNWIGENTAGMAIRDALAGMPGMDVLPSMPAALGIVIYDDGLYVTLPFAESTIVLIEDEESGDVTVEKIDMAFGTEVGQLWTGGGQLGFCTMETLPRTLTLDITAPDGQRGTAAIAVPGPGGFTPTITYSCSDRYLMLDVVLPQPVGTVFYQLSRVPARRFDDEFREMVDTRFGLR